MGKTVNLTQLKSLEKFVTLNFRISVMTMCSHRLTEPNRTPLLISDTGPVRFDGMSWFLCFGGCLDFEANLTPASPDPKFSRSDAAGVFIEAKNIDWSGLDCYMLFASSDLSVTSTLI